MYNLASGGTMLMYQPQVASWNNWKHLVAFSELRLQRMGVLDRYDVAACISETID